MTFRAWMVLFFAVALAGCTQPLTPEGRRLLQSAQQAYQARHDDQVIQAADRLLADYPRAAEADEAMYWRGLARYRRGETAAAGADLSQALRMTRRKDLAGLAHKALGDLAFDAGEPGQAEEHYRQAIEDLPTGKGPQDEVLYRHGQSLQRLGRWTDADLEFSRLIHRFEGTELANRSARLIHAQAWTVQAAALQSRTQARQRADELIRRGVKAFVLGLILEGQPVYAVQVGRFESYPAAAATLAKVQEAAPDAFVTVTQGRGQ